MADKTLIEWVRNPDGSEGATWNIVTGCSLASPGCSNCYAMKLAGTRLKHHPSRVGLTQETRTGPVWTGEVRFNADWLRQPLRWTKPRAIFVDAHGDLFHEGVPFEWLDQIFAVMATAAQHIFQVLTKRSARAREYLNDTSPERMKARNKALRELAKDPNATMCWPLPNVWLGVSVEDQRRADERVADLLMTLAAVRWISAEPLLGEVFLGAIPMELPWRHELGTYSALDGTWTPAVGDAEYENRTAETGLPKINWVVVGGESSHDALPMLPRWARSLRDQCATAGTAFLFKQWGEWQCASRMDKRCSGNSLRWRRDKTGCFTTATPPYPWRPFENSGRLTMAELIVHGYSISEAIQAALVERMKEGLFKAEAIEKEACRLGVPLFSEKREPTAMRTADRIIQRERKRGNIKLERPFWRWIGE